MKHACVIYGSVPSNNWVTIPGYEKYQINGSKEVRSFYKYCGHNIAPHYKILKGNKGNVVLSDKGHRSKFCIDYLYDICFGAEHVKSLDGELWKPIKGYEGYYRISNKGRILSERKFLTRKSGVRQFCKEQIVRSKSEINSGYYVVNLIKEKKLKHFLVHRLVAEHFLENPYGYEQVNHKDENKKNNVAENLELCNSSYNQRYGTCQERRIATRLKNNNGNYGYKRIINR